MNESPLGTGRTESRILFLVAAAAYLFCGQGLFAQWITQQVSLSPGWNSVYLEVDPAQRKCDILFANYPQIEGVWKYDRAFTTVQFSQNPGAPLQDSAHWIFWLPKNHPETFLTKLAQLQGGNAYLIKIADRAASFVWNVKGTPAGPVEEWVPNTLNLAGFAVDKSVPPSIANYFLGNKEITIGSGASSIIYSVNSDGSEVQIRQPERVTIKPGTAYWLKVDRFLHSSIPFALEGEYKINKKLDFGFDRAESLLSLRNLSGSALSLQLALLPSETPPEDQPELAGTVPLARFVSDPVKRTFEWQQVKGPFTLKLAPNESQDLRLAVQRALLANYILKTTNGAAYQALLEIRETSHGVRLLVPVVARSSSIGIKSRGTLNFTGRTSPGGLDLPLYSLSQGLWVGQAQISQVNRPSYNPDPLLGAKGSSQLLKSSSPVNERLIIHVDTNGVSRLLQRAILLWQQSGTSVTNGDFATYTDESSVPSSAQDVLRISSVTLPIMAPQAMNGIFSENLNATVSLDYDDPVNPFKHKFHPDHDNLDELFSTNKLPAGIESFNINRELGFNFYITHQLSDGSFVPPGAVVKLDGQTSYVSIDPLTFGPSATVEAWVKLESASTNSQYVFYSANDASSGLYLRIEGTNSIMTLGCTAAVVPISSAVVCTNSFPAGQWIHVTAVLDGVSLKNGATEGRIYWNGQKVAEGAMNFPSGVNRTNVYFGRGPDTSTGFLQGRIYDLTLWGDVRDENEIGSDLRLGYSLSPDNVLASFPADQGSGTTIADANGGPLKARLIGAEWDDNAGYRAAFWDIGQREGIYTEIITGLRPQPILLQGQFSLQRISKDGVLH